MADNAVAVLIAVSTTFAGAYATLKNGRGARTIDQARVTNEAYELLSRRVISLEQHSRDTDAVIDGMRATIDDLHRDRRMDRSYIERLLAWVHAHTRKRTYPDPPDWYRG